MAAPSRRAGWSFMPGPSLPRTARHARQYGHRLAEVQALLVAATVVFGTMMPSVAQDRTLRIVALGDSLTVGFELPASAAFPARLEAALKAKGIDATIANAGVSGDTAANGLARLDWSVPDSTDGVIVALGGNDMLRGIDPEVTHKALDEILRRLSARRLPVLLAGMRAAPNLGEDFGKRFDAMYPALAEKYDVLLYPFLLEGVAGDPTLNQRDGIHPTAAGIERMVIGILPKVEDLVARIRRKGQP